MIKVLKFLRNVAYVNILTIQMTFFSVYAILGLTYGGVAESNTYKYVLLISSISCYIFLFHDIIVLRNLRRRGLFFLFMPFGVIFIYLISGTFTDFTVQVISLFLILVVPSMLVGYILSVTKRIELINTGFVYVSILIAIGIFRSLDKLISTNVVDLMSIFGGGQYQALSYFSAFGFSSVLCKYLFFQNNKSWYINLFFVFTLLVLLSGVILSGGRGGALVVILITSILIHIKYGIRKVIVKTSVVIFIAIAVLVQFKDLMYYDRIVESSSRLFSYISGGGVDLSESSNRDDFYNSALFYIKDSWLFGYGPFSYVRKTGDFYSHNLFLDILLHGGVIYLFVWITVLVVFFRKLRAILKNNIHEIFLIIPSLSSLVLLLFSGTYLEESMLWFSLSYVFSYKFIKNEVSEYKS